MKLIFVRKLDRRHAFVALAFFLVCSGVLIVPACLDHFRQPVYEGNRIGAWFNDAALPGNLASRSDPELIRRKVAAWDAFARMDSNAIPFLVRMLQTPDSDLRRKGILLARDLDFLSPFTRRLILPDQKRRTAANALSGLQTRSKSSLPHLIAAFEKESDRDMKSVYLNAIAVISRAPPRQLNGDRTTEPLDDYALRVMRHARQRYPHHFARRN
jgi:hypothetical protein